MLVKRGILWKALLFRV